MPGKPYMLLLIGLFLYPGMLIAQKLNYTPSPHRMPEDLPMHHILYELDRMVTTGKISDQRVLNEWIREKDFRRRANGRINVEIINRGGENPLPADIVTRFGGEMGTVWRNRVSAWILPGQLVRAARALPEGYFMERASLPKLDDEGPAVTGSDEYRDNGADGSGINIGIIDGEYNGLNLAIDAGNAPEDYTEINFTEEPFISGYDHGTRCVENVFDHAPGANYFLYKIGNITDVGAAVDHAVENGINVLSHSISWYNRGWEDGTGTACDAARTAADNGILFCTSAGNRAQQHWQGTYSDTDENGWHNFGPGDETINITIPSHEKVSVYLCWNTTEGTHNYELYLFDETMTTVLDSSTETGNNFEYLSYNNSTSDVVTVHLAVGRQSGGSVEFEIFDHSSSIWEEHIVPEGSTTSPSNSNSSKVISVAAVDQLDFGSLSGATGIIMDYSSRGPTNSGHQAPHLTGPTNTSNTSVFIFGGTSCATPNVAGVAAAFWSSAPDLGALGVRWLLTHKAMILRDWGAPGMDYIYGYGGVQLHTYMDNTIWVDRSAGNVSGISTLPYFYVSDAQDAVTAPGRIVFLEDNYPEPIILNKADVRYEAMGDSAVLGE